MTAGKGPTLAWQTHGRAARLLGDLGPAAAEAIPALEAARNEIPPSFIDSPHRSFVRVRATAALIKIRREPVNDLLAVLENPADTNWLETVQILQELGPYAKPLLPEIYPLMQSTNWNTAAESARAVLLIDDAETATPEFIRSLEVEHDGTFFLLDALRQFGTDAHEAFETVERHATSGSTSAIREIALRTLAQIAAKDQMNLVRLRAEKMANDRDQFVRGTAPAMLKN
jgi:hypothetical protein